MDLKKFKDVTDDSVNHVENESIIKDLETRIAQLNLNESPEKKVAENVDNIEPEKYDAEYNKEIRKEKQKTFLEKIQPFILPICITFFALVFATVFVYFFSQSRIQKSETAITNSNSQPEVIIVRESKPEVKEPIIIEEKVIPECNPDTQKLDEEINECIDLPPPAPVKKGFENGTTTVLKVSFSFDRFNYDNKPRGIYLLGEQIFDGEFEGYKLNASNRPFANDFFFGVDRYMVSLIGVCQFHIDEAEILVEDTNINEDNYTFSGKVLKILEASKPHIVCK